MIEHNSPNTARARIIHGPYEQTAETHEERTERHFMEGTALRARARCALRNAMLLLCAIAGILAVLWAVI